jgi:hypothetical protein
MFVAEERDAQPLASTAGIYITAAVTGLATLGIGFFPGTGVALCHGHSGGALNRC